MLPFIFFPKSRGRGVLSNARKINWELGTQPEQPPSPQNHLAAVPIPAPGCSQGMENVGTPPVIFPGQDPAHCLPPLANARQGWALLPAGILWSCAGFPGMPGQTPQWNCCQFPPGCSWLGDKRAVQEFGGFRWDQWSQCSSLREYLAFWNWFYLPA